MQALDGASFPFGAGGLCWSLPTTLWWSSQSRACILQSAGLSTSVLQNWPDHPAFLGCESKDHPNTRNKLFSSLYPLHGFLQPDCSFHCTTVLPPLFWEDYDCFEPHFSLLSAGVRATEVCLCERERESDHVCLLGRE